MIYTCTLNPSIDYEMYLDDFNIGKLNRAVHESYSPGGKGINVSLLLNNIDIKSNLLGFVGGNTGMFLTEQLNQHENLQLNFVEIANSTRINVKLKCKEETEVNAGGPVISEEEYLALLEKIRNLKSDDIFVLSGSVPSSISRNIYKEIAQIISKKQAMLVVDATKDHLMSTLEYHPVLIKPNKAELEELFDTKLKTFAEIVHYAKILQNKGARNVLVSLGKDGAILVTKNKSYYAKAPKGNAKNTVGAGDSMVAGFVAKYIKNESLETALRYATACGSATAFSNNIGEKQLIDSLYEQLTIHVLMEDRDENNGIIA
jgi:1-phosphofructokinase